MCQFYLCELYGPTEGKHLQSVCVRVSLRAPHSFSHKWERNDSLSEWEFHFSFRSQTHLVSFRSIILYFEEICKIVVQELCSTRLLLLWLLFRYIQWLHDWHKRNSWTGQKQNEWKPFPHVCVAIQKQMSFTSAYLVCVCVYVLPRYTFKMNSMAWHICKIGFLLVYTIPCMQKMFFIYHAHCPYWPYSPRKSDKNFREKKQLRNFAWQLHCWWLRWHDYLYLEVFILTLETVDSLYSYLLCLVRTVDIA